jgi:succinyl-diaminopimelate desuccinylase
MRDPIALTRDLLRFNTINPPGNERACAEFLGRLLEGAGFAVSHHEHATGRTTLMARIGGDSARLPICFTGHMDVVPLGATAWQRDPFAGELEGDRVYGRGASDMKGGIAAIIVAALALAPRLARSPGLLLIITAGEETGCEGARYLVEAGLLPRAGAMVVAEPTDNRPYVGHKGLLWIEAETRGVTAHGSMPEKGDNALLKMATVATRLGEWRFDQVHPVMGAPTLNVATLHSGLNTNSVPDRATLTMDIRTVPGQDHAAVCATLGCWLCDRAQLRIINDVPPVYTEPQHHWVQSIFATMRDYLGETPTPATITFSTDAAFLKPGMADCPTVILGPGEPSAAHQTDEWARLARIRECADAFTRIMRDWCAV